MSGLMRLGFFVLVSACLHGFLFVEVNSRMKDNGTTKVRTTLVPILKALKKTPEQKAVTGVKTEKKSAPLPKLTRAAENDGYDLAG